MDAPWHTVALVMGADSGKSLMSAMLLLHRALFADLSGLRPGQRGLGLLVAPDTRLARIPYSYARGIVNTSQVVSAEVEVPPTSETILFSRGSEISILPATAGGSAVRGRRFVAVVLEETAFFRDSDFQVNDLAIVRAIRPRLLPGAQLVGISTPYKKSGWLWDVYRAEHGRQARALVLQAGTEVMRPDKSREKLAEQYDEDPESAAAELGAQFLENVSGLFETADLDEAVDRGESWRERPRDRSWQFVASTDPSGLRNDPWAFTVLGRLGERIVQFVSMSWKPGVSVDTVVTEIRAELKRFGLSIVYSDQFGSEVTKAHFSRAGVHLMERPFTAGPSSPKTVGFRALKDLVQARKIRLLDDQVLLRELKLLEVTRLSGGGERIAAPGRLHDDRACALALAVSEIGVQSEGIAAVAENTPQALAQFMVSNPIWNQVW